MNDAPVSSEVVSYWSADDAFGAEVPEPPGCAADRETAAVAPEWIETARKLGRPVPAPRPTIVRVTRRQR